MVLGETRLQDSPTEVVEMDQEGNSVNEEVGSSQQSTIACD